VLREAEGEGEEVLGKAAAGGCGCGLEGGDFLGGEFVPEVEDDAGAGWGGGFGGVGHGCKLALREKKITVAEVLQEKSLQGGRFFAMFSP
jgi:hypothetical protein